METNPRAPSRLFRRLESLQPSNPVLSTICTYSRHRLAHHPLPFQRTGTDREEEEPPSEEPVSEAGMWNVAKTVTALSQPITALRCLVPRPVTAQSIVVQPAIVLAHRAGPAMRSIAPSRHLPGADQERSKNQAGSFRSANRALQGTLKRQVFEPATGPMSGSRLHIAQNWL